MSSLQSELTTIFIGIQVHHSNSVGANGEVRPVQIPSLSLHVVSYYPIVCKRTIGSSQCRELDGLKSGRCVVNLS